MNHPSRRKNGSRRAMLSRLGESTASMLTFEKMRGPQSPPTPSNTAHHHNEDEDYQERVRRSPSRRSPSRQQPPLYQLFRGHHDKLRSPTKNKKDPPSTALAKDTSKSLKPAPFADICLPALDVEDNEAPETTAPPVEPKVRKYIALGDKVSVPLIGVQETVNALHQDRCIHTSCYICQTFLYCIETANSVLCPECKSIGPVDFSTKSSSSGNKPPSESLVGMGLTVEQVVAEYQRLGLE